MYTYMCVTNNLSAYKFIFPEEINMHFQFKNKTEHGLFTSYHIIHNITSVFWDLMEGKLHISAEKLIKAFYKQNQLPPKKSSLTIGRSPLFFSDSSIAMIKNCKTYVQHIYHYPHVHQIMISTCTTYTQYLHVHIWTKFLQKAYKSVLSNKINRWKSNVPFSCDSDF